MARRCGKPGWGINGSGWFPNPETLARCCIILGMGREGETSLMLLCVSFFLSNISTKVSEDYSQGNFISSGITYNRMKGGPVLLNDLPGYLWFVGQYPFSQHR
jgi:hypothetical protein